MSEGSVRDFCRRILEGGDLGTKLAPPGSGLDDTAPRPPLHLDRPARDEALWLESGAERLPAPRALSDPSARARCLARFAHHELQAVELFAWALLRWPELPAPLRSGLLGVLAEEQEHCRLYLERLRAHGSELHEHRLSGYFWRNIPEIAASPHGPRAFLCAMGLTYEQANLDFAPLYARAFREAGDDASADVCERVHADEIKHVRLAATWIRRLSPDAESDVEAYEEAVPFPLCAARAKGRRFDVAARRQAGLSEEFIAHVKRARSPQEAGPRGA